MVNLQFHNLILNIYEMTICRKITIPWPQGCTSRDFLMMRVEPKTKLLLLCNSHQCACTYLIVRMWNIQKVAESWVHFLKQQTTNKTTNKNTNTGMHHTSNKFHANVDVHQYEFNLLLELCLNCARRCMIVSQQ